MAIKVVPNEVAGWDVVREDEDSALSNHATLEQAEAAARLRAEEERIGDEGGERVVVRPEETHAIDDARQGVKPAFLALGGLLLFVTVLLVVLALTGALTGFGA